MIKFVDVVPLLLQKLPFHSLLRCATEGPEHLHYMHMCLFYQHTPRGGGKTHADPILLLFEHMYRSIRWKIATAPQEVKIQFEEYVKKCLDSDQVETNVQQPQPVVSEVKYRDVNPGIIILLYKNMLVEINDYQIIIFSKSENIFNNQKKEITQKIH